MVKKETVYVCDGTCAAVISEARYNAGLTKCGAKECTMHGHSFRKTTKEK